MEGWNVMIHFHLSNIKNKSVLVKLVLGCLFSLLLLYLIFYTYDLYSVATAVSVNAEIVKHDKSLKEVTDFEIRDRSVIIDNIKHDDVNIIFYLSTGKKATTYYSSKSNTLVQSLPKNFGFTFLISTKFFLVISLLGVFCLMLATVRFLKINLNVVKNTKVILGYTVLLVVYLIFMLVSLLFLN